MVAGVSRRASTRVGRPSNEPWTTRSSRGATPMIAGRIQSIGGAPGGGRAGLSRAGGAGGGGPPGFVGVGCAGEDEAVAGAANRDVEDPPLLGVLVRGRFGGEPL